MARWWVLVVSLLPAGIVGAGTCAVGMYGDAGVGHTVVVPVARLGVRVGVGGGREARRGVVQVSWPAVHTYRNDKAGLN